MKSDLKFSPDVLARNPGLKAELENVVPASKYGNNRTVAKGMVFASGEEAAGAAKLILLDERHLIFGLRLQTVFPLPELKSSYRADATFSDLIAGALRYHVVDFKGYETREFKLKAAAFKEHYGQEIEIWSRLNRELTRNIR